MATIQTSDPEATTEKLKPLAVAAMQEWARKRYAWQITNETVGWEDYQNCFSVIINVPHGGRIYLQAEVVDCDDGTADVHLTPTYIYPLTLPGEES